MSSPPVTLQHVAKKAGVSATTASHALRGSGVVKMSTREKVHAAAAELGYQLDLNASALARRSRSGSARYVKTACLGPGSKANVEMLESTCNTLKILGHNIEYHTVETSDEMRQEISRLYHAGVDGLLFYRTSHLAEDLTAREMLDHFYLVEIGQISAQLPIDRVRTDHFLSTFRLWKICHDRGFRRIGAALMSHRTRIIEDDTRLGGILAAQSSVASRAITKIPPFLGNFSDEKGLLRWLRKHRPDCVIGFHGGIRALIRDHGFDCAFINLHLTMEGPYASAGMSEQLDMIGEGAARLLDHGLRLQLRGFPAVAQDLVIPAVFHDHPSFSVAG